MTFELKPEYAPVVASAIQAGLIASADEVIDAGIEVIRHRLEAREAREALDMAARREAVRRMQEFADTYRLTLGEPMTRDLLHDGHRF